VKRLLVVDDNELTRRMLQRILGQQGYSVTAASTLAEARVVKGRFDVGVFDGELPNGTGVDLAADLLMRGVVARAVFFTATDDAILLSAARALGTIVRKDLRHLLDVLANLRPC
jgi:CheY-like chemotaxis protein